MSGYSELTLDQFIHSTFIETALARNVSKYVAKWEALLAKSSAQGLSATAPGTFQAITRHISWNWAAFFFGVFWGLYRGVNHQWAVFAFVIVNILLGEAFPGSFIDKAGYIVSFAMAVLYGCYGNAWLLASLLSKLHDNPALIGPSPTRLFLAIGGFIFIMALLVAAET